MANNVILRRLDYGVCGSVNSCNNSCPGQIQQAPVWGLGQSPANPLCQPCHIWSNQSVPGHSRPIPCVSRQLPSGDALTIYMSASSMCAHAETCAKLERLTGCTVPTAQYSTARRGLREIEAELGRRRAVVDWAACHAPKPLQCRPSGTSAA